MKDYSPGVEEKIVSIVIIGAPIDKVIISTVIIWSNIYEAAFAPLNVKFNVAYKFSVSYYYVLVSVNTIYVAEEEEIFVTKVILFSFIKLKLN